MKARNAGAYSARPCASKPITKYLSTPLIPMNNLNALIDESRTAGDTGILGSLVPRLLVPTTLADETAYTLT